VSYLTEELVEQGHEVTLFASGDSDTGAHLMAPCRRALRLDAGCVDHLAYHVLMLEQVYQLSEEFDVIHFHIDYLHFPGSRRRNLTQLTTLHGRLDLRDLVPLYQEFTEMPVVSISRSQREPLPWLNWVGTVHHGLPRDLYRFHPQAGTYLAFLGRISPEKGLDDAIKLAKQTGLPLKIAAKVDRVDREYFEARINPQLNDPLIEYLGEIGGKEKEKFLGNALALLAPVNWCEPFGLVLIEALACGTPVIAYDRGSIPEIIRDGVTGFVVSDLESAAQAILQLAKIDRSACRRHFEAHFTAERMTCDYEVLYQKLVRMNSEPPVLTASQG
jgi:glycosyltransferase involved in cell wall biosynthesis